MDELCVVMAELCGRIPPERRSQICWFAASTGFRLGRVCFSAAASTELLDDRGQNLVMGR